MVGYVYGDSTCGQRYIEFELEQFTKLKWLEFRCTMWTTTVRQVLQRCIWPKIWSLEESIPACLRWDSKKCNEDLCQWNTLIAQTLSINSLSAPTNWTLSPRINPSHQWCSAMQVSNIWKFMEPNHSILLKLQPKTINIHLTIRTRNSKKDILSNRYKKHPTSMDHSPNCNAVPPQMEQELPYSAIKPSWKNFKNKIMQSKY